MLLVCLSFVTFEVMKVTKLCTYGKKPIQRRICKVCMYVVLRKVWCSMDMLLTKALLDMLDNGTYI